MKRILKFKVDSQTIQKDGDFSGLVRGSVGYLSAQFNFSSEWNGCKIAASFWANGKEYAVMLRHGMCEIPPEVLTHIRFYVQCTGMRQGFKIKSNKTLVRQD